MAVLRYFHQDPRQTSVQESSVIDKQGTVLTQKLTTINQSITNNTQVLEDKLNSVPGKSLSTNDFTDEYKNKLRGIEEGAEVNVQSDWGEDDNTADSYIKNKPTSLPASDVYDWAKQPNKPSYNLDEVPDGNIRKLSNYIPLAQKGIYGGVATLGANDGKVPESQLPSYVDDVLEYTNNSQFPVIGESGKIYVNTTTNLTYRWTGTLYTEISPSIALGETSSTAYAGDKGKALADSLSSLTGIVNDTQDYQDTLDWNTRVAIAKINGTEITAKLPSNPDTWRPISDSINTVSSTISASLTAVKAAYDLAASKTSNTGTVTSVGLTVPTGLSVSGSPVTTSGTLAITYASGYSIPTTAKLDEWDAKQNAISDLSTIRTNASNGNTAYGWGNHANAGYLMAISDLATIRDRADEGHVAYGWGNHAEAGYVTSSGVTSIKIKATSPIVSSSSSAITTTGTRYIGIADAYGDIKNPYGAKTANTILAGPTTGSAAVPTFRELEQSDIPTLDWSKINATVSTTTVGSASASTNISADDITAWDPGATPTLGTAIPADDITAWDAGSTPTLGTAISADDITAWSAGSLPTLGTAISADDITAWSAGTLPTLGTAIPADDITDWTTNVPTEVVPNTVVIGGSTTSIPNISKKTVVTSVTKKTVVTGGSTTDVPNISKKTVVTGGSTTDVPNISKKTVVTGGSTTDVPNISKKTVITSVSLSGGILTINTGDSVTVGTAIKAYTTLNTGDSVTVGTPIKAYTSLTTGDSVTVGDPIKAYTSLTTGDSVTVSTGDSVTVGAAIKAYTSLTTGPAATVTAGTAASLDYSAKSIPNITGVGTLPSLSYTSRSIPNITGVGTLPSLSYTSRSIPNVTDVGTAPSLTYTAKSIPNVTSVGSTPTLTYASRSIPNISVTNKTVVTGITTP